MTRTPTGVERGIGDYYDRAAEESRLEQGAFQLEQARARELIERHAHLLAVGQKLGTNRAATART